MQFAQHFFCRYQPSMISSINVSIVIPIFLFMRMLIRIHLSIKKVMIMICDNKMIGYYYRIAWHQLI